MGPDTVKGLDDVIFTINGKVIGKMQTLELKATPKKKEAPTYKEFNSATMKAHFKYVRLHNSMENQDYLSLLEEEL